MKSKLIQTYENGKRKNSEEKEHVGKPKKLRKTINLLDAPNKSDIC